MNWIIQTGRGLKTHSAHPSLDAALRAVHANIMRGRADFDQIKWEAFTGDDNGVSDGTLTLLSWIAPSRPMTNEEIDAKESSGQIDKRTAKAWKKIKPRCTDWDAVGRAFQFVGEPTDYVSICREDRHRQYLARAGELNDVTDRVADLDNLTKPKDIAVGRRVLPQKGTQDA